MASKRPKRDSLSRYFKDLDEYEDSSGDSGDETNEADSTSNEKSNDVAITKSNSINNTAANKLASKPETTSSELQKNVSPRRTDVKEDMQKKNKLPSASECLSTRSNPSFLKVSESKEINWDAREKRLGGGDDNVGTTDFTSNAVPPPESYEPITDPGIKVVDSEGRKRKTIWSDLEDQTTSTKAYKVHKDDGDDEGGDDS